MEGAINGGIVGSANGAWGFPGNTPGFTTILGADPSGNYLHNQTATAGIDNATFQGFVNNPGTFHGLGVTAGAGSTAHFLALATLTGSFTGGEIRVLGATDWSAAAWDNGTKTLSINGSSDVSGGNVNMVSGTTLSVGGSATLGGGNFSGTFASNGTLAFGSSANQTLGGAISGAGSLTKSGTGVLTITSPSVHNGGTTVNAGTLQLQANGGNGILPGTLTVNAGGTVETTGDGTGLGFNAQRLGTLNINGGSVTSAGQIHVWSMGGGVNMQGGILQSNSGVSTTSGPRLEWGNTQLNTSGDATATIAGRINIRTDSATNFRANVADGASATDLLVTAAFTQSSASGVLAKLGVGTMEITSTGNSLGQISAAGGNLVLSGSSTFAADNVFIADSGVSGGGSGTLTIRDNATLTVGGNFMAGNWNNTLGVINQSGGTVNLNGTGSSIRLGHWPNGGGQGGIYNLSGGTVNMPNTSMYVGWDGYGQMNISGGTFNAHGITSRTGSSWGDVLISSGTLNVGAGGLSAAPWFHLDGGTIRAAAPFTMDASTVFMNGTTFDTNGNDVLITSTLQNGGAGGLVKTGAGTLTLTAVNGYTGITSVLGGTLLVQGALDAAGLISVSAGGTLGGNGTVGSVDITDDGILSPGASAGHLTVNTLTLYPGAILNFELGAPTLVQDPGSDFVTVTDILALDGTINITALAGFGSPSLGDSWRIMSAANGITDLGVTIGSAPALAGGLSFAIDASSNTDVFLTVVPEGRDRRTLGSGASLLRLRKLFGRKP
jgi:fibronectin-binding autotransporter adhesin